MIQGKGTKADPLTSLKARLMDISLMETPEKDLKIVIFIEVGDAEEIHALGFEIEDVRELSIRALELIDAC